MLKKFAGLKNYLNKRSFSSSAFYDINTPSIKILKQPKQDKITNIIALLDAHDDANPPRIIQPHLDSNRIKKDLKDKKNIVLYGDSKERFEKCYAFVANTKQIKSQSDRIVKLMTLGAQIARTLKSNNISESDLAVSDQIGQNLTNEEFAAILSGITLGNYKFSRKGQKAADLEKNKEQNINSQQEDEESKSNLIKTIYVQNESFNSEDEQADFLLKSAKYSLLARELTNERANVANTNYFLNLAKEFQEKNSNIVKAQYIVGEDLAKQGLNLLYNVGKGSNNPPILVNLSYRGDSKSEKYHALVGKGVVFDAGGLNIKSTGYMETMYMDKAGACASFATFKGAVEMGLPVNLTMTICLAENFLGDKCYRPSDIITSLKGLTVEVGNTDAEGRLCLADAMTWTQKNYSVSALVEFSTLTGACKVALGDTLAGLFSNSDELSNKLLEIGQKYYEPLWRLPICEEHNEAIKGTDSDLKSTGGRYGGASNAAAFLQNFVEKDVKWAHIDIAGPSESTKERQIFSKGATGFGVRLMLKFLKSGGLSA